MVAFADGSAADGWRSLALVLTAVGLGALGLLFLLLRLGIQVSELNLQVHL